MRNISRKPYRYPSRMLSFLLSAGLALMLSSCTKEETGGGKPVGENETEVTISISVPSPSRLTRALDSDDEKNISSIELLVFDPAGKYLYTSNARDITVVQGNTSIRNFQAVLRTGDCNITLLANCRDVINGIYPDGIPVGTDKSELIAKLMVDPAGKWKSDPSVSGYIDIPMWGEIGSVLVTESMTSLDNPSDSDNTFEIHRMVAKVDVTTALPSTVDFELTSVSVYYYNDKGSVIPNAAYFNGGVPSVPTGATKIKGPLVYDGAELQTDANGNPACVNEIYLFEARAGSKGTHPEHVCLVIGGLYKGVAGYYRVDFQGPGKTYLDILRNYHYQVIITDVADIGFPDPDEALDAFPVDLSAQIIDWTTAGDNEFEVGGSYRLRLSDDQLTFSPDAATQLLYIYTDHPGGWKLDPSYTLPPWLSLSVTSGAPDVDTEVKVTVLENDNDNTRVFDIPVIVDNFKKTVRFAQRGLGDADLEVFVTPNPVMFAKVPVGPTTFTVSTYPFDAPLYFEYNGDIVWTATGGIPADGYTGRTIQLQPEPNNTAGILSGVLTVYIRDDYGHIASCAVELGQVSKMTGFEVDIDPIYPALVSMDYTFRVKSEVAWEVKDVGPTNEWMLYPATGVQPATGTWVEYTFVLTGNPGYMEREFYVTVYSPDTGESTVLTFVQDFIPPYLTTTASMDVLLPPTGSVALPIIYNVPWAWQPSVTGSNLVSLYNLTNITPAQGATQTATPTTEKNTTLRINLTAYTFAASTPKAGIIDHNTGIKVSASGYAPYPGPLELEFKLRREVPNMTQFSGTGVYRMTPPYEDEHSGAGTLARSYGTNGFSVPFPSAEFEVALKMDHNCSVQVYLDISPTVKTTVNHQSNLMSMGTTFNVKVPQNNTNASRTVNICIDALDTGARLATIPITQYGQSVSVSANIANGTRIVTGGQDITLTISGSHNGIFPVLIADGQVLYSHYQRYWFGKAEAGTTTYRLPIPHHHGKYTADREITVAWVDAIPNATSLEETLFPRSPGIVTIQQSSANYKLTSTGRVVARGDLIATPSSDSQDTKRHGLYRKADADWVTAMGIEDTYLTTLFNGGATYPQKPNMNTDFSCASYSEPDDGGKTWYVPTIAELQEIYNNRAAIGGFQNHVYPSAGSQFYHSSTEVTATTYSTINFNTGAVSNRAKNQDDRTRCVRTP